MKVNQAGLELIKRFEGLRLRAYQDVAGIWTIGYGHIKNVVAGMKISAAEAEEFLKEDLAEVEAALKKLITVKVNSNEFDALASLVFNIGTGAFKNSTTLRQLNKDNRLAAADAIELWNKATVNGKKVVIAGLAARRAAEKGLFLTPIEELPPLVKDAPKRVPITKGEETVEVGEPGPSSRESPVQGSRQVRDSLVSSRTLQGGLVTLVTGGATAAPPIVEDIKNAVDSTKSQIQDTTDQINAGAAKVQAAIPQAQEILTKAQDYVPALKSVTTNPTVVHATAWLTAHQHEIVGGAVFLASAYIIFARIDDWLKGRR